MLSSIYSFVYYENQTELLIQNVGVDHNGNFTCLAISDSGSGVSEPVNLKVLCKWFSFIIYYFMQYLSMIPIGYENAATKKKWNKKIEKIIFIFYLPVFNKHFTFFYIYESSLTDLFNWENGLWCLYTWTDSSGMQSPFYATVTHVLLDIEFEFVHETNELA